MSRRRVLVGAAALASLAAACQILAGIQDHRFATEVVPLEAGDVTDAGVADAPRPPDPCAHAAPPPRPDAGFDETKNTYVLAVRAADFSGSDEAGAPIGYDLDGVCTCDTTPNTARGGASSCMPPGPVPCDFDAGVDNAFYTPFRAFGSYLAASGGSSLLGNQAECGRETLLLVIAEYNGRADDGLVKVGLVPSYGIREPHDAGERDSDCTTSPDPPYPAKWDGTDLWSFAEGTAVRNGNEVIPLIGTGEAYVTGYTLVVPPVRAVTVFLGAGAVEISSPFTVATLVGVDSVGNDVPPTTNAPFGFRISDAVLTGRISTQAVLTTLGGFKPKAADGGFLCNFPLYAFPVKAQVCAARDVLSDPVRDFQNHPDGGTPFECDAVSAAIRFSAQSAQIGSVYTPEAGPDGACPTDWADCK